MAEPDHVTGVEPRGSLEAFFAVHDAASEALSLVMCDVVGLKQVNERDGFRAGDACLRRAADRLRSAAAAAAMLARLGGDELIAVFTGTDAAAAANHAAARLAEGSAPPLRAAAIVKHQGETCGAAVERLYAIVRRS
jgi:diguanylate cyclase (GGDEF)-like protein